MVARERRRQSMPELPYSFAVKEARSEELPTQMIIKYSLSNVKPQ